MLMHDQAKFLANAPICLRCEFHDRTTGFCQHGTHHGRMAEVGYCPKAKFGEGSDVAPAGWLEEREPKPNPRPVTLAGDLVAAWTERFGIDRVTKLISKWTGRNCGCAQRRQMLNKLDYRLRSRLRKLTGANL